MVARRDVVSMDSERHNLSTRPSRRLLSRSKAANHNVLRARFCICTHTSRMVRVIQRRECRNVERETPWENRIHSPLNLVGKQTSLTSNRGVTSKCSNFADWRTLLSNNSDPRWTKSSSPASVSSEPSDQSRASRTERLRETQQTNDRIMLWLQTACVERNPFPAPLRPPLPLMMSIL